MTDYNRTDLTTGHASSPVYSGAAETDIVYFSDPGAFVTGDSGYTWCNSSAGANTFACDQQFVNFRSTNTNRALACHETGHGVGLVHGANSSPAGTSNQDAALACMKKSVAQSDYVVGGNNLASINSMY